MRATRQSLTLTLISLMLAACGRGVPPTAAPASNVSEHSGVPVTGPAQAAAAGHPLTPGDQALDFTLPSSAGRNVHLAGELETGGRVVLVFYLGRHCQLCLDVLRELEANRSLFEAHGARLVAIATQTEAEAAGTAVDAGAHFAILADEEAEVAKHYGVQRLLPGKAKAVQSPLSVFIVDANGLIRWSGPGQVGGAAATDAILAQLAN